MQDAVPGAIREGKFLGSLVAARKATEARLNTVGAGPEVSGRTPDCPRRTCRMPGANDAHVVEKEMKIGDELTVNINIKGKVIGRTYEKDPKLDILTPWGILNAIPLSVLERGQAKGGLPANVSMVPQDLWQNRKTG